MELWIPPKTARVCSSHFIDGMPTADHPYPTEKLGYDSKRKVDNIVNTTAKPRRKKFKLSHNIAPSTSVIDHDHSYLFSSSSTSSAATTANDEEDPQPFMEIEEPPVSTSSSSAAAVLFTFVMFLWSLVLSCPIINFASIFIVSYRRKLHTIQILSTQVVSLLEENDRLRRHIDRLEKREKSCKCKLSLFDQLIKNDKDILFYTGIPNVSTFKKLYEFISPFVGHLWRGAKQTSTKIKRKFKSVPRRFGPQRKISGLDQFLLMWMKLRLNAPLSDLADRFNISISTCSRIFSSWTRASADILKSFIFLPDQGMINATRPPRFSSIRNLNMIIDCSELFMQSPKNHILQRLTWSSYKHNTLKFLIGILPNSMITFISQAYCGSISDKEICVQSNFFESLEPYSTIMADKGFQISQECVAHRIHLIVPPGRRGQTQMLYADVQKTKEIAQMRILVEQVIRRLKTFRILTQELPLNLVSHVDDILLLCSAVTNMKQPIMK